MKPLNDAERKTAFLKLAATVVLCLGIVILLFFVAFRLGPETVKANCANSSESEKRLAEQIVTIHESLMEMKNAQNEAALNRLIKENATLNHDLIEDASPSKVRNELKELVSSYAEVLNERHKLMKELSEKKLHIMDLEKQLRTCCVNPPPTTCPCIDCPNKLNEARTLALAAKDLLALIPKIEGKTNWMTEDKLSILKQQGFIKRNKTEDVRKFFVEKKWIYSTDEPNPLSNAQRLQQLENKLTAIGSLR